MSCIFKRNHLHKRGCERRKRGVPGILSLMWEGHGTSARQRRICKTMDFPGVYERAPLFKLLFTRCIASATADAADGSMWLALLAFCASGHGKRSNRLTSKVPTIGPANALPPRSARKVSPKWSSTSSSMLGQGKPCKDKVSRPKSKRCGPPSGTRPIHKRARGRMV